MPTLNTPRKQLKNGWKPSAPTDRDGNVIERRETVEMAMSRRKAVRAKVGGRFRFRRLGSAIDDKGEKFTYKMDDWSWKPTQKHPHRERAKNRRRNKAARASRKANRA